jgi:hypothetical protein
MWKRFRQVSSLPERDRKAVIRLINSLSPSPLPTAPALPRASGSYGSILYNRKMPFPPSAMYSPSGEIANLNGSLAGLLLRRV